MSAYGYRVRWTRTNGDEVVRSFGRDRAGAVDHAERVARSQHTREHFAVVEAVGFGAYVFGREAVRADRSGS